LISFVLLTTDLAAMAWQQNYAPLGSVGVSALVAALPIATLLILLAFGRVRAHIAALAAWFVAAILAVAIYRMPLQLALAAAGYGAAFGILPIGWIVLNAVFIYSLSVEAGEFALLQKQLSGVSRDRRIQALLVAFSFGAFIEGAAGFGTPVAITGALLIGLGFRPLEAAKLALIGNTAPVAFGAIGIPLVTLNKVTGLDLHALSAMVGRQLPLFSVIVPFWLIVAQAGWRGMVGVWPACLITGLSFGLTQFLISNFHGPWLASIASAVVSMAALAILMRWWKPAEEQPNSVGGIEASDEAATPSHIELACSKRSAPSRIQFCDTADSKSALRGDGSLRAWMPWIFLSLFVFLWGLPPVKNLLNGLFAPDIHVPLLDNAVLRVPPVVARATPEPAVFAFNALSATGTALLGAGILAGLCLGLSVRVIALVYARTFWRIRVSLVTIAVMLALGFTTRYSGTDTTLGLALAGTGVLFPFFCPLIGWLGVALTGSDTSSNVLFGNLQQVTAQRLGLSPILMAASNSSGGVMGKMIDAQSIVVASVATGWRDDSPYSRNGFRYVLMQRHAHAKRNGHHVFFQS
jgi:lactate permease